MLSKRAVREEVAASQTASEKTAATIATTTATKGTSIPSKPLQPITPKQCNNPLTFLQTSNLLPPKMSLTSWLLLPPEYCFPVAPFVCSHKLNHYG